MSNAASAYAKNAQASLSPRELESHILIKAASKLQALKDDWSRAKTDLFPALMYNRKLWTIIVAAMQEPDRPVPDQLRQNILNLGVFVFGQTYETQIAPSPEKLTSLIEINRNLAAGLRGRA
jgi:flagellar protein FlaF